MQFSKAREPLSVREVLENFARAHERRMASKVHVFMVVVVVVAVCVGG
jgi:hypothetical protein